MHLTTFKVLMNRITNMLHPYVTPGYSSDPDLPKLPKATVLEALEKLPDLSTVTRYHLFRVTAEVNSKLEKEAQDFCKRGGGPMKSVLEFLYQFRISLGQLHGTDIAVHPCLLWAPLRGLKEALDAWDDTIDKPAYSRAHSAPRDQRYNYMGWTISMQLLIAQLVSQVFDFGEEESDLNIWIDEMQSVMSKPNWRSVLELDHPRTYERLQQNRWADVVFRRPEDMPADYVPYGLKEYAPHWVHNPQMAGIRMVLNLDSSASSRCFPHGARHAACRLWAWLLTDPDRGKGSLSQHDGNRLADNEPGKGASS